MRYRKLKVLVSLVFSNNLWLMLTLAPFLVAWPAWAVEYAHPPATVTWTGATSAVVQNAAGVAVTVTSDAITLNADGQLTWPDALCEVWFYDSATTDSIAAKITVLGSFDGTTYDVIDGAEPMFAAITDSLRHRAAFSATGIVYPKVKLRVTTTTLHDNQGTVIVQARVMTGLAGRMLGMEPGNLRGRLDRLWARADSLLKKDRSTNTYDPITDSQEGLADTLAVILKELNVPAADAVAKLYVAQVIGAATDAPITDPAATTKSLVALLKGALARLDSLAEKTTTPAYDPDTDSNEALAEALAGAVANLTTVIAKLDSTMHLATGSAYDRDLHSLEAISGVLVTVQTAVNTTLPGLIALQTDSLQVDLAALQLVITNAITAAQGVVTAAITAAHAATDGKIDAVQADVTIIKADADTTKDELRVVDGIADAIKLKTDLIPAAPATEATAQAAADSAAAASVRAAAIKAKTDLLPVDPTSEATRAADLTAAEVLLAGLMATHQDSLLTVTVVMDSTSYPDTGGEVIITTISITGPAVLRVLWADGRNLTQNGTFRAKTAIIPGYSASTFDTGAFTAAGDDAYYTAQGLPVMGDVVLTYEEAVDETAARMIYYTAIVEARQQ